MSKQRGSEDKPEIASVVVLGNRDESMVLRLAANLLLAVDDPLGSAVLDVAALADQEPRRASHIQVIDGQGVVGSVNGHGIVIGSAALFSDHGLSLGDFENWDIRLARQGQRVVFVAVDGELAAFLSISPPRTERNDNDDSSKESCHSAERGSGAARSRCRHSNRAVRIRGVGR
ncbi:MAG TPA: hypothetical protein VFR18_25705 [Terriglobia bacterium]|nr:hypothetical protein [Terriglobia bacterium]